MSEFLHSPILLLLAIIITFGNAITVGSAPNNLVNPDVKWETSEQFNVGADMTFYNGMIRASFDWFKKY